MSYLETNLQRLLHAFEMQRAVQNPTQAHMDLATTLSHVIPLAHGGTSRNLQTILTQRKLISQAELLAAGTRKTGRDFTTEQILGTDNDVFFYAGTFRYPKVTWGILFKVDMEHRVEAKATPFDSGGLWQIMRPNDDQARCRSFLQHHELPVPQYRMILQKFLAGYFEDPFRYLTEGGEPIEKPPLDLTNGDCRQWTYEVRINHAVPLDADHIHAIFVPATLVTRTVEDTLAAFQKDGISIRILREGRGYQAETLRQGYLDFLKGQIGDDP